MLNKKIIILGCLMLSFLAIPAFAHAKTKVNLNLGLGLLFGPRFCAPCPVQVVEPVIVHHRPPRHVIIEREPHYPRTRVIRYYDPCPYRSEVIEYYYY